MRAAQGPPGLAGQPGDLGVQLRAGDAGVADEVTPARVKDDGQVGREAQAADISRAVEAARQAFDTGPWPQLTHAERAGYLRAIGAELVRRG